MDSSSRGPRSYDDLSPSERKALRVSRRAEVEQHPRRNSYLAVGWFRLLLHASAQRAWVERWGHDAEFFAFFTPASHHAVFHDGCCDLAYLKRCARRKEYPTCQRPTSNTVEVPLRKRDHPTQFVPVCKCRRRPHARKVKSRSKELVGQR
jgi:hypothetical protein